MILMITKWLLVYVLEHKHNFHFMIIFDLQCGFNQISVVNFWNNALTTQRLPWSWTTFSELKQWLFLDDEMWKNHLTKFWSLIISH